MNPLVRFLLHPVGATITPVFVSLCAWLLPSLTDAGKGYQRQQAFGAGAWAFLIGWYLVVVLSASSGHWAGIQLGSLLPRRRHAEAPILSTRYLWVLTALALVGVGAVIYVVITRLGLGGVIAAMQFSQANQLKVALYEDYEVGVLSLRYVTILAAGVSVFQYLVKREIKAVHVIAIVLLLVNAAISSRLSLIWAMSIGGGLYYTYPGEKRPFNPTRLMIALVLCFAALTLFNYTRNYGSYEKAGVDNPIMASVAEMQRYLAAPFQGGLSAAANPKLFAAGVDPWILSGIDLSLTTNSALFTLLSKFGYKAFALIAVLTFGGGIVMGYCSRRFGDIVSIGYFVMWYCFAEIWRTTIFYAGITLTLFAVMCLVSVFDGNPFGSAQPRGFVPRRAMRR